MRKLAIRALVCRPQIPGASSASDRDAEIGRMASDVGRVGTRHHCLAWGMQPRVDAPAAEQLAFQDGNILASGGQCCGDKRPRCPVPMMIASNRVGPST